jgi:murein DD-endopeptidase MepM/ murein hydrolase activator NlpD
MGFLAWPLESNRIRRDVTNNTFGTVRTNADGTKRDHQGWDLVATPLTACYAIADGTIKMLDFAVRGYGKSIGLEFSFQGRTLYAVYAHLSLVNVAPEIKVMQGEVIGYTGNSGNARGMTGEDQHLHFEIRTDSRGGNGLAGRVDPATLYGRAPRGVAILESHRQKRLLSGSTGLKMNAADMRKW